MAFIYVGGTTGNGNGATSYTVSLNGTLTGGLASSPAAGDLIVVFFGTAGTATATYSVSGNTSGTFQATTAVGYSNDTWDSIFRAMYQIAGSTPDTTLTVTRANNTTYGGACLVHVWRGVDSASPYIGGTNTTASNQSSNALNPPSYDPAVSGALVIAGGMGTVGPAAASGYTTFTGAANARFVRADGSTADVSLAIGSYGYAGSAVDPGAVTGATTSTSASWVGITLGFRAIGDATVSSTTPGTSTASGSAATVLNDETTTCTAGAATASGSTADSVEVVNQEKGRVTWAELETPPAGTQIAASAGAATASGSTAVIAEVIVTNVEQMVAWGWDAAFTETMGTATGTATAQGPPADSISVGADETVTSTAPGASTASGLGASIFVEVVIPAVVGTATASGSQAALEVLNTAQVTWVELEFPTAGTQIAAAVGTTTASGSTAAVEFVIVAATGTATAAGQTATAGDDVVIPAVVGEATATGSAAAIAEDSGVIAAVGNATAAGSTAGVSVVTVIEATVGVAEVEEWPAEFIETMSALVGTATATGLVFASGFPIATTVGTATAYGTFAGLLLETRVGAFVGTATAGNYDFTLEQGESGRVTWVQLEVPNTGALSIYSGAPAVSYAVGAKAGINFTAPAGVGTATATGLPAFVLSDFVCSVGTATGSGSTAAIFDGYVAAQVGTATADAYDFYLAEISDPVDIPAQLGTATAAGLKSAHPIEGQNHGHATWAQFEVPVYTGATYVASLGTATARGSLASIYDDAAFNLDAPLVLGVSVQLGITGTIGYSIGEIPTAVGNATASGSTAGVSVDAAFDLDGPLELPVSVQLGLTGTLIIQTDIVTTYAGTATAEGVAAEYLAVVNVLPATSGTATAGVLQAAIGWADNYPTQVGTATATGQRASVSYSIWCFPGSATGYRTVATVYQGEQVACAAGTATASGSTADSILGGVLLTCGTGAATAAGVQASFDFGTAAWTGTATATGALADVQMLLGLQTTIGVAAASGSTVTLFWSEYIAAGVGVATASGWNADTGLSGTPSFFSSWASDERGVTYSLLEQRLRGIIVEMYSGVATNAERETTTWREDFSDV